MEPVSWRPGFASLQQRQLKWRLLVYFRSGAYTANRLMGLLNQMDRAGLRDLDIIHKNLPNIGDGLCESLREVLRAKLITLWSS